MQSITIFREITLKQIVTKESKEITRQQMLAQMDELTREIKEIEDSKDRAIQEFTLKGAELTHLGKLRQQFDIEIAKLHVSQDELQAQIASLDELEVGQEIIAGSVEGPWELSVGDSMEAATNSEIVIKDGIIVEIR